jgi:hypothetical protein
MLASFAWSLPSGEPTKAFMRPMNGNKGRIVMNHSIANHSIVTADRNTHLKVVVVALIGAIMVVAVGIMAHVSASGIELAGVPPKQATKVGVVKASKPVVWTGRETSTVR